MKNVEKIINQVHEAGEAEPDGGEHGHEIGQPKKLVCSYSQLIGGEHLHLLTTKWRHNMSGITGAWWQF